MNISINSNAENIKNTLEKLTGIESVNEIKIKGKFIESIYIENKPLGRLFVHELNKKDSAALFDFYFNGLTERSRILFPPYPLFNPPINSVEELSNRITNWRKEDDWTFLNLVKIEQIIGVCLLKRFKTERPTSGLAVREKFQKIGLGILLQSILNEQVRLLKLKRLYVTLAQDNMASLQVHKKCGFKETGRIVPHFGYKNGIKIVDRHDIEMVKNFNYG